MKENFVNVIALLLRSAKGVCVCVCKRERARERAHIDTYSKFSRKNITNTHIGMTESMAKHMLVLAMNTGHVEVVSMLLHTFNIGHPIDLVQVCVLILIIIISIK